MKLRLSSVSSALMAATLVLLLLPANGLATPATPQPAVQPSFDEARVASALKSAPVMFVENVGQFDAQALFQVQGAGSSLFLTDDALWYSVLEKPKEDQGQGAKVKGPEMGLEGPAALDKPQKGVNIKTSFVGANPHPKIEPFNRLDTHVSYFIGNDSSKWHPDVPVWGGVRYVDLYPGIDLEITSENGRMVQRAVTKPGADPNAMKLKVEGVEALNFDGDSLSLETAAGRLRLALLNAVMVDRSYVVESLGGPAISGDVISRPFSRSILTSALESTQDAFNLTYSTFFGGGGAADIAKAVALDASGMVYITGSTSSWDLPTTPGGYDRYIDNTDVFVCKFDQTRQLIYSTFVGGDVHDYGWALAVDSSGAAYVAGRTMSPGFPTTGGSFDSSYNGDFDGFVTKLNSTGTGLVYSTFLGGGLSDGAQVLALDTSGAAHIAGWTDSSDFPIVNAFDPQPNGGRDGFVAKLNPAGAALDYSTYLGGSGADYAWGVAVDASGAAYVGGNTASPDFPATPGAYDNSYNGNMDAFVAKFRPDGASLDYATFLGGSGPDGLYYVNMAGALALDSSGAAYIAAQTVSPNFPTTPAAYDTSLNLYSAFVSKLNPAGSDLVFSTFLGGSLDDVPAAAAVDALGRLNLAGFTRSADFPTTADAYDRSFNGGFWDVFVGRFDPSGSELDYSTFIGGSAGYDQAHGLAIDGLGTIYVVGGTDSPDFPTTPDAYDASLNGVSDAFLTVLDPGTYRLSVNPPSRMLEVGKSITFTISLTSSIPLDSPAELTASNLPPGVNATFEPSAVNFGGISTLAIESAVSTPTGTYPLALTARGVGWTRTLVLTLEIFRPDQPYEVYLPVLMKNAYGGWTSSAHFQNKADGDALVTIDYYDADGNKVGTQEQAVRAHGSWAISQSSASLSNGFAGSAIVRSDQPIAAIVNETRANGDGMSYNGFTQNEFLSNGTDLPVILNNAYGGWTTGTGLMNVSGQPIDVTMTYYDKDGRVAGTSTKTSLPANGYWAVYQGGVGLPDNFAGSAKIRATGNIAVVVNEINSRAPKGNGAMSYVGEQVQAQSLYVPVVLNNAYGGWSTGIGILNSMPYPWEVTITYYDEDGNAMPNQDKTIVAGNGYWGVFQGAGQLPDNFVGSAKITSNGLLVAIVNEVNYASSGAMSYNAFFDGLGPGFGGSNTIYLPAIMKNGVGFTTGISLKNLGTTATTATVTYYDQNGSEAGTETRVVNAGGYHGLYQGALDLPDGFVGNAVITADQPLVAIVNEISADGKVAMSYDGMQ